MSNIFYHNQRKYYQIKFPLVLAARLLIEIALSSRRTACFLVKKGSKVEVVGKLL